MSIIVDRYATALFQFPTGFSRIHTLDRIAPNTHYFQFPTGFSLMRFMGVAIAVIGLSIPYRILTVRRRTFEVGLDPSTLSIPYRILT